jgi:integrase
VRRHEISWRAVQPVLGTKRLTDIAPFDLERYRRTRKQAGKSDATINRELAFLRHVYSMAVTWGKAAENPVKKVRFAREDNGRVRMLSPEEEVQLLANCGPQLKPLVIAALHTGFRASELLSLTWDEVDFRRHVVTVRAAYAKNGESRSVPMNKVLTEILRDVRMVALATEQVFCNLRGKPYRSFRTAFERAVRIAGLVDFTFHDLRHTFASRLVMRGVDLPTVKDLLGHKTIAMTLRYTHLSSDHKQRAVSTLEPMSEQSPSNFHNSAQQPSRLVNISR